MTNFNNCKRHIHHKDKNNTNNKISNLVVCCAKCHKRLDGYGKYTDYAKNNNISVECARYKLNPEARVKRNIQAKKYTKENKEKIQEYQIRYRKKNRETILEKQRLRWKRIRDKHGK